MSSRLRDGAAKILISFLRSPLETLGCMKPRVPAAVTKLSKVFSWQPERHTKHMGSRDHETLLNRLVVGVLPGVTPYQFAGYVYLLNSVLSAGPDVRSVKVGKRSLAAGLGRGARSSNGDIQHIAEKLRELHEAGLIRLGDSDRAGTSIEVRLPSDVPWVREALSEDLEVSVELDYFCDPGLRRRLFDRDAWRCRYCGMASMT